MTNWINGPYKNMLMEMEERGEDFTGKYVFPNCFSDTNLLIAFTKLGIFDICKYSGKVDVVVPMNVVVEFVRHFILKY